MLSNSEIKLKVVGIWLVIGIVMGLSSVCVDHWFYLDKQGFSLMALNLHSYYDFASDSWTCLTSRSFKLEFQCFCESDSCEFLRNLHFAGEVFFEVFLVSLLVFMCGLINLKRKIERMEGERLENSWLDKDFWLWLGSLMNLCGMSFWLYFAAISSNSFWKPNFELGPAFKNGCISVVMVVWSSIYYFGWVKKTYTQHSEILTTSDN